MEKKEGTGPGRIVNPVAANMTQSSARALRCCWCWSCVGQKGNWGSKVLWGCIHSCSISWSMSRQEDSPGSTGVSFCWELPRAVGCKQQALQIWSYKQVFIWRTVTFLFFPVLIKKEGVSERRANSFTLKWCENVCTAFRFMLYHISRKEEYEMLWQKKSAEQTVKKFFQFFCPPFFHKFDRLLTLEWYC